MDLINKTASHFANEYIKSLRNGNYSVKPE